MRIDHVADAVFIYPGGFLNACAFVGDGIDFKIARRRLQLNIDSARDVRRDFVNHFNFFGEFFLLGVNLREKQRYHDIY